MTRQNFLGLLIVPLLVRFGLRPTFSVLKITIDGQEINYVQDWLAPWDPRDTCWPWQVCRCPETSPKLHLITSFADSHESHHPRLARLGVPNPKDFVQTIPDAGGTIPII